MAKEISNEPADHQEPLVGVELHSFQQFARYFKFLAQNIVTADLTPEGIGPWVAHMNGASTLIQQCQMWTQAWMSLLTSVAAADTTDPVNKSVADRLAQLIDEYPYEKEACTV